MSMITGVCPKCGVERPAESLDGLCSRCVGQWTLREEEVNPSHANERFGDYELLNEIASFDGLQNNFIFLNRDVASFDPNFDSYFFIRTDHIFYGNDAATHVPSLGVETFGPFVPGRWSLRAAPILSIRVSQVELCWDSDPAKTCQLQYRSMLTGNQWMNLGAAIPGDGTRQCVGDSVPADSPKRFYQLLMTP